MKPTQLTMNMMPNGKSRTDHYYLFLDEVQKGPFTVAQLRSMWNSGSITAHTLYWCEGFAEWRPLSQLASLLEPSEHNSYRLLMPLVAGAVLIVVCLVGLFVYMRDHKSSANIAISTPAPLAITAVSTPIPPVTEKLDFFLGEGHRLISAMDTGVDLNEFHDRVIELKASSEEALSETTDKNLEACLSDFVAALDDTYVLWSHNVPDYEEGDFSFALAEHWARPEPLCAHYQFDPESSHVIVEQRIAFFSNPIPELFSYLNIMFSRIEQDSRDIKNGIPCSLDASIGGKRKIQPDPNDPYGSIVASAKKAIAEAGHVKAYDPPFYSLSGIEPKEYLLSKVQKLKPE